MCFSICRFSQVVFIPERNLTHNLFFLFPIVFGINYIFVAVISQRCHFDGQNQLPLTEWAASSNGWSRLLNACQHLRVITGYSSTDDPEHVFRSVFLFPTLHSAVKAWNLYMINFDQKNLPFFLLSCRQPFLFQKTVSLRTVQYLSIASTHDLSSFPLSLLAYDACAWQISALLIFTYIDSILSVRFRTRRIHFQGQSSRLCYVWTGSLPRDRLITIV